MIIMKNLISMLKKIIRTNDEEKHFVLFFLSFLLKDRFLFSDDTLSEPLQNFCITYIFLLKNFLAFLNSKYTKTSRYCFIDMFFLWLKSRQRYFLEGIQESLSFLPFHQPNELALYQCHVLLFPTQL